MPRTITIWHVYDESDMAQSDSFFETKKAAIKHIREAYDVTTLTQDEGTTDQWTGRADEDGWGVHLVREDIEITRAGLCRALQIIPCR